MRYIFTTLLLLAWVAMSAQSDITLVKSIRTDKFEYYVSDSNISNLNVKEYDSENTITLRIKVEANVDKRILLQLVKAGRYDISIAKSGMIMFERINKTIFINGTELNEIIEIDASVPDGVTLSYDGVLIN